MSAFFFIWRRSFVNFLRSLTRKPGKMIMIVFYAAMIGLALMSTFFRSRGSELSLEDMNMIGGDLTPILFNIIALGIFVGIGVSVLFAGTNKGGTVFTMSDVHFLFTAPLRPQAVLFYGLFGTLKVLLAMFIFVPFQYPNLSRLGMTVSQMLLLLPLLIGGTFIFEIGAMLFYLIAQNKPVMRVVLRRAVVAVPFVFLIWFAVLFAGSGNIKEALAQMAFHPALRLFPLFGWLTSLAQGIFLGMDLIAWLSLALLAAAAGLMLAAVFKLPADFYEDALVQTEKLSAMISKQQTIGTMTVSERLKKHKGAEGIRYGRGASTLFFRYFREWRRRQPYLFGIATLFYLTAFAVLSYLLRDSVDVRPYFSLIIYGVTFSYLFFRSFESPFLFELTRPMIYTLPLKASQRLLWLSLTDLSLAAVAILPGSLLAAVVLKISVLNLIFLMAAIVTFPLVTTAASLLTFRLMGSIKGSADVLVLMLLQFVLTLPTIASAIAGGLLLIPLEFGTTLLLLAFTGLNLLTLGIIIPVGKSLLQSGLN